MNNSVAKELENVIDSTIGGTGMLKCVSDGGGFIFSNCAAQIVDNIDSESTHYHIINESVQSHHQTYGSCSKTLVLMISCFYHEILTLVKQGFPTVDVVRLLHECLLEVLPNLDSIKIPLHQLAVPKDPKLQSKPVVINTSPRDANVKQVANNFKPRPITIVNWSRFLQSSRHLQEDDDIDSAETNVASISPQTSEIELHDTLLLLCRGLLHGAHTPLADLLTSATERLLKAKGYTSLSHARFDKDCLQVHTVVGPLSIADCVYEGLVVQTTPQQLSLIYNNHAQPCRTLLLLGDLTPTYRHVGHKPLSNASVVIDYRDIISQPTQDWVQNCYHDLLELKVKAVLVHGVADESLIDACEASGIIVICGVSRGTLHALSSASGCLLAFYISECTQDNVACNLTIEILSSDWIDVLINSAGSSSRCVVIKSPTCHTQTVAMYHPCEGVLAVRQESLSHMASRLQHTINTGYCLPGAGHTELHVAQHCDRHTDELLQANSTSTASDNSNADQLFRVAGFQAHSKSFRKYAQTVERNLKISQTESDKLCDSISFGNGKLVSNSNAVFDDPVSKVAAWWTALQTASQLALIGYEVVTGSIDRPIGLQSGEGVFLCAL